MHIALATLEYPTESYRAGGMCWAFYKIAAGLKELGHKVTVLVPSDQNERIIDDNGVPVRRYRIAQVMNGRIGSAVSWRIPASREAYRHAWSLYKALIDVDSENRIDVVLAAADQASFFAAGSRRWPYVCRISSYWPLMSVSNFFPQKRADFFLDWMQRYACMTSDALVAPSELHCRIYEDLGCLRPRRIFTPVKDAWSVPDAGPIDHHDIPGSKFLLFYGSMQAKKGPHVLADALPEILDAYPDLHVVFIGRDLVSPGIGSMTEYVRQALARFGNRVHFEGVVDQAIAFEYIKRSEWVVLPSIMDNLPNALLESMCFARPVIVTRDSGTDDLVVDGRSGLVTLPNNAPALRDTLQRALSMPPEKKDELGMRARTTVMEQCDPARASKLFEELLVDVVRRSNRLRPGRVVAWWRTKMLQLSWSLRVFRYYRWGPPRRTIALLRTLCERYLPQYKLTVN